MFRRFIITTALFGLLTMPAAAADIAGSSGLINIPNADALRASTLEASAHFIDGTGVLALNLGLLPQVEAGVYTVTESNDLGFTVKAELVPETTQMPGIAVGLENRNAYMVLSRSFSGLRGHIGFGNGRFRGPFFGLSMMLNRVSVSKKGALAPVTTLMVEHDGYGINAGARIAFTPQLKADIAFLDMEEAMLGLSFNTSF